MSLNTCGFIYHKDEIENWVIYNKPDIFCLNETHVTEDVTDNEIKIQNYNICRTNTTNNRTGGLITYIKKNIDFNV